MSDSAASVTASAISVPPRNDEVSPVRASTRSAPAAAWATATATATRRNPDSTSGTMSNCPRKTRPNSEPFSPNG